MKNLIATAALLLFFQGFAQVSQQEVIKTVIKTFFKGFHAQDAVVMKSVLADNVILQTTGKDKRGKTIFSSMPVQKLITSITSVPDSVRFEEKLTTWSIQIDGTMANAWVGYEFWYNNGLSHCGINSFQLVNFDGVWKIVYLIDTRSREGCTKA